MIFGTNQFFFVRLVGVVLDSLTCVMVALLARRYFGTIIGLVSGFITAIYGPMIFYSSELVPVPYTLFFLVLSVLLIDRDRRPFIFLLAGFILGLSIGTRPNLLLLALVISPAPVLISIERKWIKSSMIIIGVILGIVPITTMNYMASGKLVLLTTSAGHNFYLGHRPDAYAGYTLPQTLDGDIFHNMKRLAEKVEGHKFEDDAVSAYYFRKALGHITSNPMKELRIILDKGLAAINDYEATNYVNYYYQKELSPVLGFAVTLGLLFPFAALGMVMQYRRYYLIMPVLVTFLTIILFFFIARLRMPMIPFLSIFAGYSLCSMLYWIIDKKWIMLAVGSVFIAVVYVISNLHLVKIDTSNEWNKAGIVLRVTKRYEEAEKALLRAKRENPANPNSYLNLSVLYRETGQFEKANANRQMGLKLKRMEEEREGNLIRNLKAD